jgi:hypothetical protein
MSSRDPERIAVLETRADTHEEKISEMADTLKTIEVDVRSISLKLDKNLSFFAGVAFTFSLFGAVFGSLGMKAVDKIFS